MGRQYLLCYILIFSSTPSAHAASPYHLSPNVETAYLGIGTGLGIAGYAEERNQGSPTLADMQRLDKNDIPMFDRFAAGNWNPAAQTASNVFLVSALLSPLAIVETTSGDYATIGIMYLETLVLAGGGVTLAKGTVTRYRPFTYGDKGPLDDRLSQDATRSFFSGHTAFATSGLIFTATLFADYHPQSKYKSAVWTASVAGALATGWLRVEGGKHFPSDVLAGLAWGGLVGYTVPASHRRSGNPRLVPFIDGNTRGMIFSRQF